MKNKNQLLFSLVGLFALLSVSQIATALNYTNFTSFYPISQYVGGAVADIAWNNYTLDEYAVVGNRSTPSIANFFIIVNASSGLTKCIGGSVTYGGAMMDYSRVAYRENATNGGDYIVSGTTLGSGDWVVLKFNRTCDLQWSASVFTGTVYNSKVPIAVDGSGNINVLYQSSASGLAMKKVAGNTGSVYGYNPIWGTYGSGILNFWDLTINVLSNELYITYPNPVGAEGLVVLNVSDLSVIRNVYMTNGGGSYPTYPLSQGGSVALGSTGEYYYLDGFSSAFGVVSPKIYRIDKFGVVLQSPTYTYSGSECSPYCNTYGTSMIYDLSLDRLYLMGYFVEGASPFKQIPFITEFDRYLNFVHNTTSPDKPFNITTFYSEGSIDYAKNVFLGGSYDVDPAFMWWNIGTGVYPNGTPTCGNAICSFTEDCSSCPVDCGTCGFGSFNDTFSTSGNWSNSTLCGKTGLPFDTSLSMLNIYGASEGYVHTTNPTLFVPSPFTFQVQVRYNGTGQQEALINLFDSSCGKYFTIDVNFIANSIGYFSGGSCSYVGYNTVSSPVTLLPDTWYNITLVDTNVGTLFVNGVQVMTFPSLSGCSPFTYAFLGSISTTSSVRYDNLMWYGGSGSVPSPYGYNYIDVTVNDMLRFDSVGCPRQLLGSTVTAYNGQTMELIDQRNPNDLDFTNCCSVGGVSYGCKGTRFSIPANITKVYLVANATGYTTYTTNTTMSTNEIGVNMWLLSTDIGKIKIDVIDSNSLNPIQNAMGCVFFENDSLADQCLWTSNGGSLTWYIPKNENYYFTLTADGYYTVLSAPFHFTTDRHFSSYMSKMPPDVKWYVILSTNVSGTIPAQEVKLKGFVYGVTAPYTVSSQRTITSFESINSTYYEQMQNPFIIYQNMSYCGVNSIRVSVIANQTYKNGTLALFDSDISNSVNLTIVGGCDQIPSWASQVNTTPMVNGTEAFPQELEFLEFFLSPFILTAIFVFGMSAMIAQKIGGEHKGIVFIIGILLMFFALFLSGFIPLWIILTFILIFGAVIFVLVKGRTGEGGEK